MVVPLSAGFILCQFTSRDMNLEPPVSAVVFELLDLGPTPQTYPPPLKSSNEQHSLDPGIKCVPTVTVQNRYGTRYRFGPKQSLGFGSACVRIAWQSWICTP
jgi:hypothetical protein